MLIIIIDSIRSGGGGNSTGSSSSSCASANFFWLRKGTGVVLLYFRIAKMWEISLQAEVPLVCYRDTVSVLQRYR
jgi:hypothetical protein